MKIDLESLPRDGYGLVLETEPAELPVVMRFLKEEALVKFEFLVNITGTDYPDYLTVTYHLKSLTHREKISVKVRVPKDKPVAPSIVDIWAGADWQEREAYDLLGIEFSGHPNLTRILLPDDFTGHPLRKDYKRERPELN